MLVVNRFRVDAGAETGFRERLEAARDALAACAGHEWAELGRNVDAPEIWVLVTRWRDVGSYRRALSKYDVKLTAVPVLSESIDEPSAYELVGDEPLNEARARDLG